MLNERAVQIFKFFLTYFIRLLFRGSDGNSFSSRKTADRTFVLTRNRQGAQFACCSETFD
jgi:hypothetical protein